MLLPTALLRFSGFGDNVRLLLALALMLAAFLAVGEEGKVPSLAQKRKPEPLKLHAIFSDNMVVQRNTPLKVWGTSAPEADIAVKFAGQEKAAKADAGGRWMILLDKMEAGGPYELSASSGGKTTTLKNIMVGEVWLFCGQWDYYCKTTANSPPEPQQPPAGLRPETRMRGIPLIACGKPQDEMSSSSRWDNINANCSIYAFADELRNDLKVPIGIYAAYSPGSPLEAWIPYEALASEPALADVLNSFEKSRAEYAEKLKEHEKKVAEWERSDRNGKFMENRYVDEGNKGCEQGWAKPDFDDSEWKEMTLPAYWEELMDIDGAVWFRKEIEIPKKWAGRPLTLSLGMIKDMDTAYFNGKEIGRTGEGTLNYAEMPRKYPIPATAVAQGKSLIAVRVFNESGKGGFTWSRNFYIAFGQERIDLGGPWKYMVEKALNPILRPSPPQPPAGTSSPAHLYNGMIHPLAPLPSRGIVLCQGEANTGRIPQYASALKTLVGSWRKNFGNPGMPFIIVQMPATADPKNPEIKKRIEALTEAQTSVAKELPSIFPDTLDDGGDAGKRGQAWRGIAGTAINTIYGKKEDAP